MVSRSLVPLVVVAALAAAGAGAGAERAPAAGGATVSVYFPRVDPGTSCRRVVARPRTVAPPGVLRGALTQLLRGPTVAEQRAGYGGWFSARTAGMLRSVRVANGVAYVDLRGALRAAIPNASSSCGSALLLAQLDRTALQFPSVRRAVYSFDGRVAPFYAWLQLAPPRA